MCDCVLAALTRDLVSHDTELTTRSHSYRGTISPVHPRENYCQCPLMLPCEPTLADAFQIRNISWRTVTADGFKHEANRLSQYVHLNKKITQHTRARRDTHHAPSFTMFFKLQLHNTWNAFTQQTSESAKQIKHTCESNWWDGFRQRRDQRQQRKQALRKRPTVSCPARCGSVTCDSLTSLSADPDCWLSRRRSDGEACLFPPSHWARIQGGQKDRNTSWWRRPAGNKRNATANASSQLADPFFRS